MKGGKRHRRGKKAPAADDRKHDVLFRSDDQVYARVDRMLGNGRVSLTCSDGASRLGIIRGSMRRREWVAAGDIVLAALRGFEEDKADVVHRYGHQEAAMLERRGEIDGALRCSSTAADVLPTAEDSVVEFVDVDDI